MPGQYIYPQQSNFTGGTVTGYTIFPSGISANSISTEQIITSGLTIEQAIEGLINIAAFSGGTVVGNTNFSGDLSATTIHSGDIAPLNDNTADIGTSFKRFRNLNAVNGTVSSFSASSTFTIGTRVVTEDNIILGGDTLDAGSW